jgi:hypothetical protein
MAATAPGHARRRSIKAAVSPQSSPAVVAWVTAPCRAPEATLARMRIRDRRRLRHTGALPTPDDTAEETA